MKINVVGWYGKKNVGDEAFRDALRKTSVFDGHGIKYVTPPQKCDDPDIVILGGGAVSSPFYLDILPDCPRYGLGLSLAYESEADLLAKAKFRHVFVRNESDVEAMRAKLGCPVDAMPDLAFALAPTSRDAMYYESILRRYIVRDEPRKALGVLVTDYVNPAIDRPVEKFGPRAWSFVQVMARELDKLAKDYDIILIPCSTGGYGDDRRIDLDIAAFMKTQPINIMDTLEPFEVIDLISELDATVCMRFHAHVFSIIAGRPFVSIGFTRKVELLLKENGIEGVSAGQFVGDEFVMNDLPGMVKAVSETTDTAKYLEASAANRAKVKDVLQRVRREWLGSPT